MKSKVKAVDSAVANNHIPAVADGRRHARQNKQTQRASTTVMNEMGTTTRVDKRSEPVTGRDMEKSKADTDRQTVIGDARVLTRVVHRAGTPEFLHGWSTGRVRQKGAVDLDGCFYSS